MATTAGPSGQAVGASQDRKLCSQSWSAEGARVKSQRILDGAEKLGGQAPARDRLLGVSLAITASRLELRGAGAHALVTTGGSSMTEAKPQSKSPTSPRVSRRRASPNRAQARQTQPGPTGHDRARVPWAGLNTGNRSGFGRPNQGQAPPPTDTTPSSQSWRGHHRPSGAYR